MPSPERPRQPEPFFDSPDPGPERYVQSDQVKTIFNSYREARALTAVQIEERAWQGPFVAAISNLVTEDEVALKSVLMGTLEPGMDYAHGGRIAYHYYDNGVLHTRAGASFHEGVDFLHEHGALSAEQYAVAKHEAAVSRAAWGMHADIGDYYESVSGSSEYFERTLADIAQAETSDLPRFQQQAVLGLVMGLRSQDITTTLMAHHQLEVANRELGKRWEQAEQLGIDELSDQALAGIIAGEQLDPVWIEAARFETSAVPGRALLVPELNAPQLTQERVEQSMRLSAVLDLALQARGADSSASSGSAGHA